MHTEDETTQDKERASQNSVLDRLLSFDMRKAVRQGLRSAPSPKTRALWLIMAIVTAIALAILATGGFLSAAREVYGVLSALFATMGQLQAKAEAWPPAMRVVVLLLVSGGLTLYVILVTRYMKNGTLRAAVLLLGLVVGLSAATLLVSFRPGFESVPIGPNIGVIIVDPGGATGDDQIEKAIAQSRSFVTGYADRHPNATHRAARRRPLAVTPIVIRNRARAAEDVLAAIKDHNLGYIILAANPEDLDYSRMLASIGTEAVTFVLTPGMFNVGAHRHAITIFPSPEREGEHMAHEVIDSQYTRFVVLRYAGPGSYETRASLRFSETTHALAGIQPYSSMTYASATELRKHLSHVFESMPDPPQFLYIIDSSPLQQIAVGELARHRYAGVVGLSAFALTFLRPENLPNSFRIVLPWPMQRHLEASLGTLRSETEGGQASNLVTAGIYTAAILADHAHHSTVSLSHRNVIHQLHQIEEFQPPGSIIPFGSLSIRQTSQPPKSIFNVSIFRYHNNQN